jgi:hypothetical protein
VLCGRSCALEASVVADRLWMGSVDFHKHFSSPYRARPWSVCPPCPMASALSKCVANAVTKALLPDSLYPLQCSLSAGVLGVVRPS